MREEIKVRRAYERDELRKRDFYYRPDWPYISIGFGGERDYFIENLSLLIASGMGILSALSSLKLSVKTKKMKRMVTAIEEMVSAGIPLWKSFEITKIVPERVISLIRSGEEVGRLPDHLNLVTAQQHKEKIFKSRLRTALLYPGVVLTLAFILGIASAWLVLPLFAETFASIEGAVLPPATQMLMNIGLFFQEHGVILVPSIIAFLFLMIHLLFFWKKTRFIGDSIMFSIPGIKSLLQGVELARFGYTFGVLIQAGLQVGESFDLIISGTRYRSYIRLYRSLQSKILKGDSFKKALSEYRNIDSYIPIPIQQLIISAEQSGRLAETLIRIGVIFEEKTDAMARDLSTVLEPIILILVGAIVGFVALAVIGPIYGLATQM